MRLLRMMNNTLWDTKLLRSAKIYSSLKNELKAEKLKDTVYFPAVYVRIILVLDDEHNICLDINNTL